MIGSRNATIERGVVTSAFLWPLRAATLGLFIFAGLWLFAISVQVLYAERVAGPEGALHRLDSVLDHDIAAAAELRGAPIHPLRIGYAVASTIHEWIFDTIVGAARAVMNLPEHWQRIAGHRRGDLGGAFVQEQVLPQHETRVRAAITANLIFSVRTSMLIAATPLAALLYCVALSDGLIARAIRHAGAGRESSGLYHRAKMGQVWLIAFAWMLYVCMPMTVNPHPFTLGAAAGLALLARLQSKWMKKYL